MKKFSMGMMLSSLLFIQIGCGEAEPGTEAPVETPAPAADAPVAAPPAAAPAE